MEGNLTDSAGPLENLHLCSEACSCVATTVNCFVLSGGAQWTRNSDKLRCLLLCSRRHFHNGGVDMEAGRWCAKKV